MKQVWSSTGAARARTATTRPWRRGGLLALLALLWSQLAASQTTLLNETFEGGTPGSFVAVNGAATNRWVAGPGAGNGPTAAGTGAAYISNNATTQAHGYTTSGSATVVHLYQTVTFPVGAYVLHLTLSGQPQRVKLLKQ